MHVIGQCRDAWAACRGPAPAGFHSHRHRPAGEIPKAAAAVLAAWRPFLADSRKAKHLLGDYKQAGFYTDRAMDLSSSTPVQCIRGRIGLPRPVLNFLPESWILSWCAHLALFASNVILAQSQSCLLDWLRCIYYGIHLGLLSESWILISWFY